MEYDLAYQIEAYRAFRRQAESYVSDGHTVVALIRHRAVSCPTEVAVADASSVLSYEALERQSDSLATLLRQRGAGTGKTVGILLPRTKEYIVAILAALKAGCTYVPLDAADPQRRVSDILSDAAISCLIHGRHTPVPQGVTVPVVIDADACLHEEMKYGAGIDYSREASVACIMYTSGTTGTPKGVMISHRYLLSLAIFGATLFRLTGSDRVMLHPGFTTIASFGNIYPSLISGSSLHIISEEVRHDIPALQRYILHAGISGGVLYTAIGSALLREGVEGMRWMMVGGEPLVSPHVPAGMSVYSCLGCTESLFIAYRLLSSGSHEGPVALDTPAACNVVWLADEAGRPVKQGGIGEIVVSGDVVADGYVHPAPASDARFSASPWIEDRLVFRTGDLGRLNERGMLEYCGRRDRQLKVSGYRIEPGEVEAALLGFEGITGATVAAIDFRHGKQLCAWFTSPQPIESEKLRAHVSRLLPSWMVPSFFVHTPSLWTASGDKTDVASLPRPEADQEEQIVPPRNALEEKVLAVVKQVLCCEHIGVTTDLMKAGLTSLSAMYIATYIEKELQLTLRTWQILGQRSIRQWLSAARPVASGLHACPVRRFYPLLAAQWRIYHEMLDDPSNAKNSTCCLLFIPAVTGARVAEAVGRVAEAHPSLGVRIVLRDGEPVMERDEAARPEVSLYEVAEAWDYNACVRHIRPFVISAEGKPLVRLLVFSKPSGSYLLIHCAHIIYDGASLQIFINDLRDALRGKALQSEPLTLYDVALHEAAYIHTEQGLGDKAYFTQLCKGCVAVTALRPGHEASGTVEFHVDRRLTDAYCRRMAVTANSFWMTTLLQALHRITAMSNLVVCTFSNQRSAAEVRRTSGMLLRLLPVVSRLRDQAPEVAMQALQSQLTATMAHESYPFCMLQDALHIPFGFLYIFQEGLSQLDYPEEWSELRLTRPHDDTRICCVQVFPYVSGTKVIIEYNGTTYSRSGALCLADRWQSILRHIVSQSTNR